MTTDKPKWWQMRRGQIKLIAFVVGMAIFVVSAVPLANGFESSNGTQFFTALPFFLVGFLLWIGGLYWPMGRD